MKRLPGQHAIPLLLFILVVFFNSCAKDYSYEGGGGNVSGAAVYELAGAGGDCVGTSIAGAYYEGSVLTAANTLELQANVTTAGTYTVSTNTADGIYFSGTGTFAGTGIQKLILAAAGTPLKAGTFLFTTPVGLGCTFPLEVTVPPIAQAAFTLAGAPNSCTNALVYGNFIDGLAMKPSNYVALTVNVTTPGAFTINTNTADGISFSSTGTFTQLGDQIIKLDATGTPKSPANLLFTPVAGNSQCSFGVSVLNPEPLATYVLESGNGSPSPCIAIVAGSYTAGTALDTTNTVSVRAFVTAIGNFTVATDTVNGIVFSYTGTFTVTGSQIVTLQGSGTPLLPPLASFVPTIVGPHPLGGESCGFSVGIK